MKKIDDQTDGAADIQNSSVDKPLKDKSGADLKKSLQKVQKSVQAKGSQGTVSALQDAIKTAEVL